MATSKPMLAPSVAPTDGLRLLPRPSTTDLRSHLSRYGTAPAAGAGLIDEVEKAGLTGRGGAGFPTAAKLLAVMAGRRRPIAVANGTEGEPASAKDKVLLVTAPHLVLDGVELVADLLGADQAILCVDRAWPAVHAAVEAARAERATSGCGAVHLFDAPDRYVSGEESALVHWLNGGEARPAFVPPRPFERGVDGRPTFISNVETYAHLALIARFGAQWYRALGSDAAPGTTLLTVAGAVANPGVCEAPGGSTLRSVIEAAGGAPGGVQAVLLGGYFGTWIPGGAVDQAVLDPGWLAAYRASMGCGMVAVLPERFCPLVEVSRITRWLADQNAGQCGPCVHGLPAVADTVDAILAGRYGAADRAESLLGLVRGRGACKHPDGVSRFVSSSLQTFSDHIHHHEDHGRCPAQGHLLPTPTSGSWR